MSTKILKVFDFLHSKIFGHQMSRKMEQFLVSLSWSMLGGIVAAIIIFVTNLFAARWLGPEGYGNYNLVLALASFFIVPMMLGFEVSAGRFISIEKDKNKKNNVANYIFKKASINILIVGSLILIVFLIFRSRFHIANEIFIFSLIISIALSFKGVSNGILRGKNLFKKQAVYRFLESVLIFLIFLIIFRFYNQTYISYATATLIGYIWFASSSFDKGFSFFRKSQYENKEIMKYSHYAFWGLLSAFLLTGSDKLLIGRFINVHTVGIYSVYFTVAIAPVTQIRYIFINVFFPEISNSENKLIQFKKIKRLACVALPFFLIFYPIFIFLLLRLFGNNYQIDLWLIFLFSLYAFLFFYVGTNQWILASISSDSMRLSSMISIFVGIFQICLSVIVLIFFDNLRLFMTVIILSNIVYLILNNYFINKKLHKI